MTSEQLLARKVLFAANAFAAKGDLGPFQWTIQGLGLLKMKLGDGSRFKIHVWDGDFRADSLSDMHDHHWNLRSTVLSGRVEQFRYTYVPEGEEGGAPYFMETYGVEGQVGEGRWVRLLQCPLEVVHAGETYEQEPREIHKSMPVDGTVTLVERVEAEESPHTHVFWLDPEHRYFEVTRPATPPEVLAATRKAIDRWLRDD